MGQGHMRIWVEHLPLTNKTFTQVKPGLEWAIEACLPMEPWESIRTTGLVEILQKKRSLGSQCGKAGVRWHCRTTTLARSVLFGDSGRGQVSSAFTPLNSLLPHFLSHIPAPASPKASPLHPLKLRTQSHHLALLQPTRPEDSHLLRSVVTDQPRN